MAGKIRRISVLHMPQGSLQKPLLRRHSGCDEIVEKRPLGPHAADEPEQTYTSSALLQNAADVESVCKDTTTQIFCRILRSKMDLHTRKCRLPSITAFR
jgi:hypothetical protein